MYSLIKVDSTLRSFFSQSLMSYLKETQLFVQMFHTKRPPGEGKVIQIDWKHFYFEVSLQSCYSGVIRNQHYWYRSVTLKASLQFEGSESLPRLLMSSRCWKLNCYLRSNNDCKSSLLNRATLCRRWWMNPQGMLHCSMFVFFYLKLAFISNIYLFAPAFI